MDKKKRNNPLYNLEDSLNNTVSSCDLTGLEPAPPKNEAEAESYSALGGVPVPDCGAAARIKRLF